MNDIPQPKFNIGMLVNYTKETGCILPGGKAEIILMKYDTDVKMWIYHIQNEHIGKVKAHTVGEIWIQLVEPNSEIECIKYAMAAHDKKYWVVVSNEDEKWIPFRKFMAKNSVPGHGFTPGYDTFYIKNHIQSWKQILEKENQV
ncbi:hypothetical protein [Mastigocladopsis repens]|uniref:hypothetical protein n=1 Tax=Mastigocladopsis repens TaxID=221287 RepID=UPI00036CC4A1|nr:hypothetical protein [Mastigocladopsis repens]